MYIYPDIYPSLICFINCFIEVSWQERFFDKSISTIAFPFVSKIRHKSRFG